MCINDILRCEFGLQKMFENNSAENLQVHIIIYFNIYVIKTKVEIKIRPGKTVIKQHLIVELT